VRARRFNPDGNERLTAAIGLILLVGTILELGSLLLGLQHFLSLHVFVGFVLLPPIALKLASTGWRFMRYYTRNEDYRVKGAPQMLMRLLAPMLVVFTLLLFGSGVAMGYLDGNALDLARRIHGPAAFFWTVTVGAHVLMYLRRALRSTVADVTPRTRGEAAGATLRTFLVAAAIAGGLVLAVALLPDQHIWLHLPVRQDG
jgi:hypothetical protein